ncbi:MAG: hypothetical protein OXP09_00380 [Gammaproteobacteria bacterium]|nr:hypothetical protein [Gammaproteobacteria bacterium]MDE0364008.1 hypothetical protein [Gammaproteobacteria bacterium]
MTANSAHPRTGPFRRCLTTVVAIVSAVVATAPAIPASAQQPGAAPADVESIDAIVTAVYDVISGDAGVARDWNRFLSLFAPGATLSPVRRVEDGSGYRRSVIMPEGYADEVGGLLEADGFHEVEIHRVTEQYGRIAHLFSTYESRRLAGDAEPFARGINSIQLMNDGSRWWIVSIFWFGEDPDHPIPANYLPDGGA